MPRGWLIILNYLSDDLKYVESNNKLTARLSTKATAVHLARLDMLGSQQARASTREHMAERGSGRDPHFIQDKPQVGGIKFRVDQWQKCY